MPATDNLQKNIDPRLQQARDLVYELEAENDDAVNKLLEQLTKHREAELFQEVGKLTRDLHDTLKGFRDDSRLAGVMENELPDAKERLNYVVTMTEQAAHQTMNVIDKTIPIAKEMGDSAAELESQWQQFMAKRVAYAEFQTLATRVGDFLKSSSGNSAEIQKNLSEIYMAQDFQDLTGQVIRRVIDLVQNVEESLVGMIRVSGTSSVTEPVPASIVQDTKTLTEQDRQGNGHAVPGVDTNVVQNQDDVDDLLSSLGF